MLRLAVLLAFLAVSSVHAQPQQNWAAWCNPALGDLSSWSTGTALPGLRSAPTASVLPDGRVLVTGGNDGVIQASTVLGTVSGNTITWVASTALPAVRSNHTASVLPDGRVLLTGGTDNGTTSVLATTLLGTVSGNSISWVASTALPAVRSALTASVLPDGRVLAMGGSDGAAFRQATTWLGTVSGDTISWVASTAMPAARNGHTASVLPDGRVLVTGGTISSASLATTWLGTVSGNAITWVTSTALPAVRTQHTASVLPDGRVLVTGGSNASTFYATT